MSIPQVVAGPYSSTYNGKNAGQTRDGYRLSHEFFKRLITSDENGDAPVNAIYRGRAQFVEFELIEAGRAAVIDLTEPYGGGVPLVMGPIGQVDLTVGSCAGVAKPLVLTSMGICTAAPASVTFPLAILAEGYPINMLYGTDPRQIPVRLRVYANAEGVFGTVA